MSKENSKVTKLQLLEEKLDISKKWVQTGEVTMHKEIITENKTITVPVQREILVIEGTTLEGSNSSARLGNQNRTFRIPVSEEKIEIVKHTVPLENVSVRNNSYEKKVSVHETLKKEKLHVETLGNVNIINSNPNNETKLT